MRRTPFTRATSALAWIVSGAVALVLGLSTSARAAEPPAAERAPREQERATGVESEGAANKDAETSADSKAPERAADMGGSGSKAAQDKADTKKGGEEAEDDEEASGAEDTADAAKSRAQSAGASAKAANADDDDDEADDDDSDSDDDDSGSDDDDDDDDDDSDSDDDDDDDDDDDGLQLSYQARLQSDLRFRIEKKALGGFYDRRTLPVGVERNQNLAGATVTARYGTVYARADLDFVLYGFRNEIEGLEDLSLRELVDPFRFDVHSLYVGVDDLLIDGLDLRIGQQTVLWGVGDQFNPTNNLNADDLEDTLLFGDQLGNFMVKADYWINNDWQITGVLVPVFRPALLPRTGVLGLANLTRLPMVDEQLRHRIHSEQSASAGSLVGHPTIAGTTTVETPSLALKNMQFAYRIGGTLGGQDISLSYYNGRTDFPIAKQNHTVQDKTPQCNPDVPDECIQGTLVTNVTLHYPRMHVYGFNMTGEIGLFKDLAPKVFNAIGYRIEAALIVPERSTIKLTNDQLDLLLPQAAGEYDYDNDGIAGGPEPEVVSSTPFAKWTVGLDYTFNKFVYANMQWVHGLADEFGAGDFISEGYAVREGGVTSDESTTTFQCALPRDGRRCAREILRPRLGDYLVTGIDIRFLQQRALVRLFTIFDLNGYTESVYDPDSDTRVKTHYSLFTPEGFSAVIYPEFDYNFGNGLELMVGGLFQLGKDYTKFGDPAAGGSSVWTRGRFSF